MNGENGPPGWPGTKGEDGMPGRPGSPGFPGKKGDQVGVHSRGTQSLEYCREFLVFLATPVCLGSEGCLDCLDLKVISFVVVLSPCINRGYSIILVIMEKHCSLLSVAVERTRGKEG